MLLSPDNYNFQNTRERLGRGIKVPKNIELRYARNLRSYIDAIFSSKIDDIISSYNNNGISDTTQNFVDALQNLAAGQLQQIAQRAVPDWFSAVSQYSANRFTNSIKQAMGIDATSILEQNVYDRIRETTISSNVALIRDLSGETFQNVRQAILDDYQGFEFPGNAKSLAGRIQEVMNITKERASVIARDQTAKLNSSMIQARNESAGITHYIWRTVGDQRVVGNPSGLYPRGNTRHMNHYERNGKLFAWNDPPDDGHPGFAILCRCYAQPQIIPANLNVQQV